ncbi:hypothetical protein ACHQM5_026710 [Ranunculus cassubicifolius]
MACTLGRGRMAAMARLLDTGNDPAMDSDEAGHKNLVAQSVGQDLLKADEPNLLDEEDMHVFDCRPMVDILHLVRCNNCKKPVKASQYAAHHERCTSLNCSQETFLEPGGGKGQKKPPRKGRKKLQTVREGPTVTPRDDTCTSESIVVESSITSLSREPKRNSASVHAAPVNDGSDKRTKLISTENLLTSESVETESVETMRGLHTNNVITYQKPPAPLATKMYHSQRNLRIRLALNHLYHQASSTRDYCNDAAMMGKMTRPSLQQSSGSVPVV